MARAWQLEQYDGAQPPWTPFQEADGVYTGGMPQSVIDELTSAQKVYVNSRFVVCVQTGVGSNRCRTWWLSIRETDRTTRHDWRDLQQIKNELCGPECEAIEIYPAESHLCDCANQFHLWVWEHAIFTQPGGIGFDSRRVSQDNPIGKSAQRLFAPHVLPADIAEQEVAIKAELDQLSGGDLSILRKNVCEMEAELTS